MRRRNILLGAAAAAVVDWRAAGQEAPKSAHIGFIVTGEAYPRHWFDEEMRRLGWVEGHNLTVERRVTRVDPEERKTAPPSWSRQTRMSSSPPVLSTHCRCAP